MEENLFPQDPVNDPSDNEGDSSDSELENDEDEIDDVAPNPLKRIIGEYLLYLRSSTRATNEDVTNILNKMEEVVRFYVDSSLRDVRHRLLNAHNFPFDDVINIEEIVANIDCTQGLRSIHNQDKYFQETFNVVMPNRIQLGENFVPFGTATIDGNQPVKRKKDEFIYVPISEVLTKWYENPSFENLLSRPTRNENGDFETYMDGTYFHNHAYLRERPDCKLIKLYYDEVDMCDAVGSKSSSVQKLGMFYWMDDDVSPENRSQLKFINVCGIVSNPNINVYGMNTLLEHVVQDFQKIRNGLALADGRVIYGTLSTLLGDNLAIHAVCGFRESFTARLPCRVCNATMDQIRVMCRENEALIRSSEEHARQVEEIENAVDEDARAALRTRYGINRRTALTQIEDFDPTIIPPDLTHDDWLGFCVITTKMFLRETCYTLVLITLDELNQRIANFDYGYAEKSSKPSPIKESHILDPSQGFKQTASQMAQLVTMLPLILSDKVVPGWPPLDNYLKMLEIILISHCDKIENAMLGYLSCCISEYLETFQTIYDRHLTPKQHSLVHRIRAILRFGPLQQYTTMRAESKHQFFKRIVQCMRNYKNLPLTLLKKHQLHQGYVLNGTLERDIIKGPTNWTPIDLLPFPELFPDVRRLQITKWVKVNGIKYVSSKCFLAASYDDQNMPQSVALDSIVWRNDNPLFVCRTVKTIQHNVMVMAYEIEVNDDYVCLSIQNLLSVEVFHAHRWNNAQFIILKKALGNLH